MDTVWAKVPLSERLKLAETIKTPTLFSRRFLRSDLWAIQQKIVGSVAKPSSRTNVKACHASGKTRVAAEAALWFLARFKEAIVITTAPTENQVKSILWPEIRLLCAQSVYPFPKPLTMELKMGPKRYALGFTTNVQRNNEGVQFQGFHAEHILFILDEAPGIDPAIWAAIEGARAGGDVRILGLGNPTIAGGIFYDSFHGTRDAWQTFTISAFDTPNLDGCSLSYLDPVTGDLVTHGAGKNLMEMGEDELGFNPRPYLTTRFWVKEKFVEWGPDNPLFQARVLGEFPKNNEFSLIPLAIIEKCARLTPLSSEDVEISVGIDVAGPGDAETVVVVRREDHVLSIKGYIQSDPRGAILADLEQYKGNMRTVNVDSIGIGYNFALHFRDQGLPVVMVNVQDVVDSSTKAQDRFHNKKAEYFWELRERFYANRMLGVTDETTVAQLSVIRYGHDGKGRVIVESKDDMRKRGVRSPDRAEALMLAFAPVRKSWAGLRDFYYELQKGSSCLAKAS